ncbi:hypothetical protein CP361_10460, partial [Lactobacillus sp. UMNPBX10]
MIRIYNKKIETTRHHKKLPDNVEEWERWELQLRGKRSYEWLESAKIMLSQIKYPNYQNLDPGDIAVLHSIDDRVVSFKDFSKKKAGRLRKLRKESVGYSDDYAKAGLQALEDNANKINEQVEIFLGQLNLSD